MLAVAADPGPQGRPRVRPEFRDAVTCLAVGRDNQEACTELSHDFQENCRRTVTYYRSARRPEQGLGWRCDEHGLKKCARKNNTPAECAAMCAAVRTMDPRKCPARPGDEMDGCRAMASLDVSYCRGRKFCIEDVTRTKSIIAGGLAARRAAADDQEKLLIDAALKGRAACAPAWDALSAACISSPPAAHSMTPAGSTEPPRSK